MTPFYEGWRREVVYRRARPNTCEVYYWSPDEVKLRSSRTAEEYFTANPLNNPHLSPMQLCWTRRPLGLNNLRYEIVLRAKIQRTHPPPPQPLNIFHKHPGDISAGSWGLLKPMEPEGDFNANMKDPNKKDLNAEYNTYVRAQESREDLYIRQARDYKAQIGEVKSRSAEKRAAKEAESTSPDHEVQQDHAYTKPED